MKAGRIPYRSRPHYVAPIVQRRLKGKPPETLLRCRDADGLNNHRFTAPARQSALPSLRALAMTLSQPSPLIASALVAAGGALGAVARYQMGRLANHLAGPTNAFPWGTLSVNIIGSLLMGALLGWFARPGFSVATAEAMRLLIGVGLLGGFTTFSAFSSELVTMLHRGQMIDALIYGAVSLVAGMAAIVAGLIFAQSVA